MPRKNASRKSLGLGPRKTRFSPQNIREEFQELLNRDISATLAGMQGANGKVVLNSDDLFRMLPLYANQPGQRFLLGPILYPVAAEFTDRIYAHLLQSEFTDDDTIIFTAGGSATGKTSILRTAGKPPGVGFIVDTTFSNVDRAVSQIERALGSGRKVEIHSSIAISGNP